MREAAGKLIAVGVDTAPSLVRHRHAQGYATLGQIELFDLSVTMPLVRYATSRPACDEAQGRADPMLAAASMKRSKSVAQARKTSEPGVKGLRRPVAAFNVVKSIASPAELVTQFGPVVAGDRGSDPRRPRRSH